MIPGLGTRRRATSRQQQQQQQQQSPFEGRRSSRHYHHHSHQHYHHHHQRPRAQHADQQQQQQQQQAPDTSESSSSSSTRTATSVHESAGPCRTHRLPLILQRRSESDAHRVALEARSRLDERLREAALWGRRNADNSLPRLAHHYFNALFSDEDEDDSLLFEDDSELGMSLREWLASHSRTWQPEWMAAGSTTTSPPTLQGLSKAVVKALPREVYAAPSKVTNLLSEEQVVDCSVCLESFSAGQTLLRLPCKHRFHLKCLTPWLEHHEQCPYCRARIRNEDVEAAADAAAAPAEDDNLLSWLEAFETGMSGLRFSIS